MTYLVLRGAPDFYFLFNSIYNDNIPLPYLVPPVNV